ncbi:Uncharacterised protein [Clostridioides difficile]|nr:Uncharacterised protein [Clostridioides difficile]VFF18535.1 Uncharacterised protein [Clostridioides difficile]VIC54512.1 Uncharacterised protein [Clostridioides difficile]VIC67898.1 Uncharacterised protein [Clostridioides difficile]VIC69425.1 Uncharacterised protein [Clostridioides difficile]
MSFKVANTTVGSIFKFILAVLDTANIILINISFTVPESGAGL